IMTHQRQLQTIISTVVHGGYGNGCGGPVSPDLSIIDGSNTITPIVPVEGDALPVDVAVDTGGDEIAVVYAGAQRVERLPLSILTADSGSASFPICPDPTPDEESGGGGEPIPVVGDGAGTPIVDGLGAPTSVAYTPS